MKGQVMDTGHTIQGYAKAFAVSTSTVRRMIASGQLDAVRLRRCVRIVEKRSSAISHLRGAQEYLAPVNEITSNENEGGKNV